MKSLSLHYIFAIVPFLIVIVFYKFKFVPLLPEVFIALIVIWALLYMPFLNGRRLYIKGLISKPKFIYNLPFKWEWFVEVYFKK